MNVYVRREDGPELIGQTSLPEDVEDSHVVELDLPGSGATLHLVYEIRSLPCLTPEMKAGTERAVVLEVGQTPDFLPNWRRFE